MKRAVKAFIALYFAVLMCVLGGTTAFAWNTDTRSQRIDLGEVPEGTAFADILVKDRRHDKYAVAFNEENARLLGVAGDCGLAGYDTEGYTSMLLRHSCAVFDGADISGHSCVYFKLNEDNNKLFNHFRKIKVAYCDKDGNVIGVTDTAKFEFEWLGAPAAYDIEANGENLACRVSTGPPYYLLIFIPLGILLFVAVIMLLLAKRAAGRFETAKMIKRIQSGAVDDERKE